MVRLRPGLKDYVHVCTQQRIPYLPEFMPAKLPATWQPALVPLVLLFAQDRLHAARPVARLFEWPLAAILHRRQL